MVRPVLQPVELLARRRSQHHGQVQFRARQHKGSRRQLALVVRRGPLRVQGRLPPTSQLPRRSVREALRLCLPRSCSRISNRCCSGSRRRSESGLRQQELPGLFPARVVSRPTVQAAAVRAWVVEIGRAEASRELMVEVTGNREAKDTEVSVNGVHDVEICRRRSSRSMTPCRRSCWWTIGMLA